jgi:tetratricopeptide (TPR) repeat protein
VFWISTGAGLALAGGSPPRQTRAWRWPAAAMSIAAVIAAAWLVVLPEASKTVLTSRLVRQYRQGLHEQALATALELTTSDPLDPDGPAEVARLEMAASPTAAYPLALEAARRSGDNCSYWRLAADAGLYAAMPDTFLYTWPKGLANPDKAIESLRKALQQPGQDARSRARISARLAGLEYARGNLAESARYTRQAITEEAAARIGPSPLLHVELGNILHRQGQTDLACRMWREAADMVRPVTVRPGWDKARLAQPNYMECMVRAVGLNPSDVRFRVEYAQKLCGNDQPASCLEQIDRALWLNDQLLPDSIERLNPAELVELALLKARARCLLGQTARPPVPISK